MKYLSTIRFSLASFFLVLTATSVYGQQFSYSLAWQNTIRSYPSFARSIQRLRSQLNYKFALDFLLAEDNSELQCVRATISNLRPGDSTYFEMVHPNADPHLLEEFSLGDYSRFALYRATSFSDNSQYALLTDYVGTGSSRSLFLFKLVKNKWKLEDVFRFNSRFGGDFMFVALNHHQAIRVRQPDDATGYYREDEAYLAIVDDKLKTLFGFERIEIVSPANEDDAKWTIGTISLIDLNDDGFLDIVHTERIEIVHQTQEQWENFATKKMWLRLDNSEDFFSVKPDSILSSVVRKYIWNGNSYSFDHIK